MSGDRIQRLAGWAVTLSALGLLVVGGLLLIAREEVGAALVPHDAGSPLISLLGGALVGFGAMNWIARRSALGGIYGRAVVVGNQVHFVVGSLVLLRHGFSMGGSPMYWVIAGLYILGAALFSFLLFSAGTRGK